LNWKFHYVILLGLVDELSGGMIIAEGLFKIWLTLWQMLRNIWWPFSAGKCLLIWLKGPSMGGLSIQFNLC